MRSVIVTIYFTFLFSYKPMNSEGSRSLVKLDIFKTSHFLNRCKKIIIQNVSFIVFLRTAAVTVCSGGYTFSIL